MFSALIKAFTGRAGFLSSVLALSLIALTSVAVLLTLPRIEQGLENAVQPVLSENMAQNDSLDSVRAEGRNLLLEGQFSDAAGLSAKLQEVEGVRRVIINGSDVRPEIAGQPSPEPADISAVAASDANIQDTTTESLVEVPVTVADTELDASVTASVSEEASTEPQEQEASSEARVAVVDEEKSITLDEPLTQFTSDESDEPVAGEQVFDQSSLSLRYDGTELSLSGHLADEQMAQLIADRVTSVIPAYSVLEINLDGKGKGSPLHWMGEFLRAVSGLPDDAQGKIEGSDQEGVKVIPDLEQTLATRDKTQAVLPDSANQSEPGAVKDSAAGSPEEDSNPGPEPEAVIIQSVALDISETEGPQTLEADTDSAPVTIKPAEFINALNARIAEQALFESGEYAISDTLAAELDGLAEIMRQNPDLLLRVVGNIDFSADQRFAEYVGTDRAREVKRYLLAQRVQSFRVFATPLPRDRAYDKRVQLVFYISE